MCTENAKSAMALWHFQYKSLILRELWQKCQKCHGTLALYPKIDIENSGEWYYTPVYAFASKSTQILYSVENKAAWCSALHLRAKLLMRILFNFLEIKFRKKTLKTCVFQKFAVLLHPLSEKVTF